MLEQRQRQQDAYNLMSPEEQQQVRSFCSTARKGTVLEKKGTVLEQKARLSLRSSRLALGVGADSAAALASAIPMQP